MHNKQVTSLRWNETKIIEDVGLRGFGTPPAWQGDEDVEPAVISAKPLHRCNTLIACDELSTVFIRQNAYHCTCERES